MSHSNRGDQKVSSILRGIKFFHFFWVCVPLCFRAHQRHGPRQWAASSKGPGRWPGAGSPPGIYLPEYPPADIPALAGCGPLGPRKIPESPGKRAVLDLLRRPATTHNELKLKFRENDIIYRYWAEVKEFRARIPPGGVLVTWGTDRSCWGIGHFCQPSPPAIRTVLVVGK
jgi:hypothetical protein